MTESKIETLFEGLEAFRLGLVAHASDLGTLAADVRTAAKGDRHWLARADALERVAVALGSGLEALDRLAERANETQRMSKQGLGYAMVDSGLLCTGPPCIDELGQASCVPEGRARCWS